MREIRPSGSEGGGGREALTGITLKGGLQSPPHTQCAATVFLASASATSVPMRMP